MASQTLQDEAQTSRLITQRPSEDVHRPTTSYVTGSFKLPRLPFPWAHVTSRSPTKARVLHSAFCTSTSSPPTLVITTAPDASPSCKKTCSGRITPCKLLYATASGLPLPESVPQTSLRNSELAVAWCVEHSSLSPRYLHGSRLTHISAQLQDTWTRDANAAPPPSIPSQVLSDL